MRTMGLLFCKEGLQGIFVILFTKYIMFFFLLFLPLSSPLSSPYDMSLSIYQYLLSLQLPFRRKFLSLSLPVTCHRVVTAKSTDRNKVAQMFFFNGLASTIFRAITGRLCDLGRNVPIWIMRFTVLVSGTLVILMTLSSTFYPLLACFVVYGMMDGAIASSMNILVLSTLSTKQKSQGIGFFHLCVAVTLVAGPPLGGKLYFNTFTQSEM